MLRLPGFDGEDPKFHAILGAIGDGVSIQDPAYRVIYQNDIHKGMVGEQTGRFCYEAYEGKDRVCEGCPVAVSLRDGEVHRVNRSVPREGGTLHVEITSSPIRDDKGNVVAAIEIVRDISERVRMEDEILRSRKLDSIGVLAGGIAHDFNNLLTVILGNLSLAKTRTPPGEKAHEWLSEAEKASIRAQDLTNQLLTFSRGGAPVKETLDIADLVRESASFGIRGSRSKCVFRIPDGLWPVDADKGQLGQVIGNLVINADQAMPQGGIVEVLCHNVSGDGSGRAGEGNRVEIVVRDHGVGIPAEHLERIFDPYFTTKREGSGLGLATVHAIVRKHGGAVSVSSSPGAGATFRVSLPASMALPAPPTAGEKAGSRGAGRVLVMDDESAVLTVTGAMLEGMGFEPSTVLDGDEAVTSYRTALERGAPFDAVIMDLTVPGGVGGI